MVEKARKPETQDRDRDRILTREERTKIINEILDDLEKLHYFDYCKKKPNVKERGTHEST
jgi:hypothetical protein